MQPATVRLYRVTCQWFLKSWCSFGLLHLLALESFVLRGVDILSLFILVCWCELDLIQLIRVDLLAPVFEIDFAQAII